MSKRERSVADTAQQLAQRVVRDAAAQTLFAQRLAQKPRMKGGLGRNLFVRNADGQHATDPVSLNRIPVRRAVAVGKRTYNSKTLRALLAQNPHATDPLTRQPFPERVYKKYVDPRAVIAARVASEDEHVRRANEHERRQDAVDIPRLRQIRDWLLRLMSLRARGRDVRIDSESFLTDVDELLWRAGTHGKGGIVDDDDYYYTPFANRDPRHTATLLISYSSSEDGFPEYQLSFQHRVPFDGVIHWTLWKLWERLESGQLNVNQSRRVR